MKRVIEWVFLLIIGALAVAAVAMWQNHQMKSLQYLYPVQSAAIKLTSRCEGDAPTWLKNALQQTIGAQGGVSAQVVYFPPALNSPKNESLKVATCHAGFTGNGWFNLVTDNSRYRYASLTKIITADLLLTLVQQGKLHLDQPLIDFLPELAPLNAELKDPRIAHITLKHLLDHQAGFNRSSLLGDPMFLSQKRAFCPTQLEKLADIALSYAPGEKTEYSNLGYCLLGEVIARTTGKPFKQIATEYLPLAENNIRFVDNYFYDDEVVYDYRFEDQYWDSYVKLFNADDIASAAGLSGSAKSFAALLKVVNSSQKNLPVWEVKTTAQCNPKVQQGCYSYGMGYFKPDENGLAIRSHEGYLPGAASVAIIDQFGGITVLVKSGKNRPQKKPQDAWVPWFHKQLSEYYRGLGLLP
ncbi:MAG: serine hydrolase domain-containing protein [Cellvibrio sp.]